LHASTHWGTQALCDHFLRTYVCIGLFEIAKTITRDCLICQRVNKKVMRKMPMGGRELAKRPFQSIQIDFTELPQVQKFKYILVIIDHLTHWVEAYPTRATAEVVSNMLLGQIVPRYGVVHPTDSDRGLHLTARVLQQITRALNITWRLHTPWRPQSSGRVERMNQTLKKGLTKLTKQTKMNWLKCLPLALMRIRTKPRTDIGVSPYEMMFGLPFLTASGNLGTYEKGEQNMRKYVQTITSTLEELRKKGYWYLPQTTLIDFYIHKFKPGDWVLIRTW
ncbi:TF211 protein, partial [Pomatostomus ruficeps]|nr:TF211 protein [Pomatostomus ruficeps]